MAEEEGKPKADIPDLKKAAAERFAWTPGAVLPPSAAPSPGVKASAGVVALVNKLKETVVGRIALLAVLTGVGFGVGVGVLGLMFLEVGEAKPTDRKGLGAILSRLHVRPEYGDRLRYLRSKGEVFFTPLRGGKAAEAPDAPPEQQTAEAVAAAAAAAAAQEAAAQLGDVDVQVNTAGGTRAGVLSGGVGGSASAGAGGGPGAKGAASRDAGTAKFNESNTKLNAKSAGKGRVTRAALATSGGRNAGGATNLGDYRRSRTPIAGPARGPDGTPSENRKSGLDFVLGGGGGAAAGAAAPAAAAGAAGAEAGGGGGGGGGGSGDSGAGPGAEDVDNQLTGSTLDQINTLMRKSAKESDKQAEHMKKAAALAAAGLHPGAAYEYMQADKAKKKSKQYSDQAQQLTQELSTQYKSGATTK